MLAVTSATAQQQQPQPPVAEQQLFLTEALAVLQRQRNDALDAAANAEARVGVLLKQVRALQDKLKTVEDAHAKKEPQK